MTAPSKRRMTPLRLVAFALLVAVIGMCLGAGLYFALK